jgi:hypothetical protein
MAGIGSLVPAGAAVAGSVALSLLILHPPPAGLPPGVGAAPADREHLPAAVVLPAPHAARSRAPTEVETPRRAATPTVAVIPPRPAAHSVAPPATPHGTPSPPPTQTIPTPVTEPVTTPVTTPVTIPSTTAPRLHTNKGRWKSQKGTTWKAGASKQNTRTQKGKPPWAGQGNDTSTAGTTPPAAAPQTSKKTPPGHAKKQPGQTPTPPEQTQTPPEQNATPPGQDKAPPGQDKTPPGQEKKGQSPPS